MLVRRMQPPFSRGFLALLLLVLVPVSCANASGSETTGQTTEQWMQNQALERWRALPESGRRCRIALDDAAMRIAPSLVLRRLQWDAGRLGPEGAAYAGQHSGNDKLQERRFAENLRNGCREALAAEPLPPGRPGGCRTKCAVLSESPDVPRTDLEFLTICLRCKIDNAVLTVVEQLRHGGLPTPSPSTPPPGSIEKLVKLALSDEFGAAKRMEQLAREAPAPPDLPPGGSPRPPGQAGKR